MAGTVKIDSDRFIHDTIDGETVIIDTIAGRLTLLVGIGPIIWTRLFAGAQPSAILGEIDDLYGPTAKQEGGVFIDELSSAGLLVESGADDDPATPTTSSTAAVQTWPKTYVQPGLEHYDDIADIMTMDPIHEVDTSLGWPNRGTSDAQ
jgi:hypothetical protein